MGLHDDGGQFDDNVVFLGIVRTDPHQVGLRAKGRRFTGRKRPRYEMENIHERLCTQ